MTNFEKIKQMTVEEMAKIITCPYLGDETVDCRENCIECCEKWLESEVEDNASMGKD